MEKKEAEDAEGNDLENKVGDHNPVESDDESDHEKGSVTPKNTCLVKNATPTSSISPKYVTFNYLMSIKTSDRYFKDMEEEELRMNAHLDKMGVNVANDIVNEMVENASESVQGVNVNRAITCSLGGHPTYWPYRPSLPEPKTRIKK